jgi:hypothetical protein
MKIDIDKRENRGKKIRLLCFLISGLLVMTASAAVYNYTTLQASPISAATAKVVFADGTDAAQAGASVGTNGTCVQFNSISGWPNATRVYENATIIRNTDAAVDFSCLLSRDSWSGNTVSLSQLYVRIFNAAGSLQGTLDAVAGNTTTFTIPHGEVWRVEWNIKWSATALSTDTVTATLTLRVTGEGTGE